MSTKQKKFKLVTLGCRTNQYETQAIQNQLLETGWAQAEKDEEADLCVVNTCTVTESADSHSRHEIRRLSKDNPNARIAVTGCFAENKPDAVKALDGVTDIIGNKDKENLLNILYPEESFPEFSIKNFDSHTRAFVKVQDGCNSFCTYCIIPYVRGRSRSRTMQEVVDEVKDLIANGYKEIVLTGINIGDFDGNKPKEPDSLADLVRLVDRIPGLERLRLSSIDPDEVDEDLADAILNGTKTCHSLHIVLQSGSNIVLKRMNRKYTRQMFFDSIEKLRNASPNFTFTTDLIVGFPGETEEDHEETLDAMQRVQFAKVHMFPYSDRPRTRSALMPNKVPHDIIKRRKQEVLRAAEQGTHQLREQYIGKTMKVLTESPLEHKPGYIGGHTENFLYVIFESQEDSNQIVEVKLLENSPEGLIGKQI